MGSKFVTARMPADLYDEFQEKCSNEDITVSQKVRQFIDDYLYPSSETQAASPAETDEATEPGAEQPILEERITQIEERVGQLSTLGEHITQLDEKILHLDEPLGHIFGMLDNIKRIQRILCEAVGVDIGDESEQEPGEIGVEEEHLGRVQGNPAEQKEEQEKERGEEDKSKQHLDLPFFKEPKKEPEKKG